MGGLVLHIIMLLILFLGLVRQLFENKVVSRILWNWVRSTPLCVN
ncbi:hypothetical protein ACMBCN_00875 [Candidatus Liberibacter asiaticus]